MVIQIAFGIFFGFLFLAMFVGLILGLAYYFGKKAEEVPHFIEEPKQKQRKHKSPIQEWWDSFDEGDDY